MRRLAAFLTVLSATLLAGCGPKATTGAKSSLVLDFTPNAIHAGIYDAISHGAPFRAIVPGQATDAVKLLVTKKVNFAVLDIHDLAIADQQGKHLVGLMAVVQRPLASVLAAPQISSPRQLAGQTVGISGDPSDTAVLNSIVAGSGANPKSVKTLNIGYNAVPDLLAKRVQGATAFWNDEGQQLAQRGFHVFRVEKYGAPPYPELVLAAPESEIAARPGVVRSVVRALSQGYQRVLANPAEGAKALEAGAGGLSPSTVSAQLKGELPAFRTRGPAGSFDTAVLKRWAGWELAHHLVSRLPNVRADFTNRFLG
ncbi:MAG: ABC transporter substrate-binding protein [Solirubrobacterales bacterium]|nr:ABC transporter substrate-binding protein [Solirubrobacterales bacterium]